MVEHSVVDVELGTSILDKIQELNIAQKIDILKAIAIKSVGHKHIEQFNVNVVSGVKALGDDIEPILPNSRMLTLIQLSWSGVEPNLQWRKSKGGLKADGKVLSNLAEAKVTGSDYQFNEPVTRGTKYNVLADQNCTFDYVFILEFAIGF